MATIMWDLDGVATSFVDVFYPWLCDLEHWEPLELSDWHFHRPHGLSDVEMGQRVTMYADWGGFSEQAPVPGFSDAVKQINQAGNTQHVVTSRPQIAEADTAWWLDTYAPEIDTLTLSDDKAIFMQYGPPLYFAIDDKVQHVEALLNRGVYAYLLRQSWNASRTDLPAVDTVKEFADIVTGRGARLSMLLRSEAWRNAA